ncbi:hypothetical protein MGN70_000600 [Eutypa lata]|nr:hypothetical protein MGN70_000600 [Eutypa lata]
MWSMHTFILVAAALGPSATAALSSPPVGFGALESRQGAPSPESNQCHADCGYTILDAALPDHCTNSTWTGMLDDCLDCALVYDIWKDYGEPVAQAAQGCGLDATPEQPSSTSSSSAPPSTTTTHGSVHSSASSSASGVDATPSVTGGAQPSNTNVIVCDLEFLMRKQPTSTSTPEGHAESIKRDGSLAMFAATIGVLFGFGLW